ncbi:MAG: hypothetical protein K2O03_02465, partial [Lachnospiraceae bacterium]|nr:hypothetical protein [Lachnospiraceae bacterium]
GGCTRFAREIVLPLVGRRIGAGIISGDIIPCPSDMLPPADAHDSPGKLSSLWSDGESALV